jgi:hypothetical protein
MNYLKLLFCVFMYGCSSKEIAVRYENAELIKTSDLSGFSRHSPELYLKNYDNSQFFILINFVSNVDLIKYSINHSLWLSSSAYFCDEPNREVKLSHAPVFQNKKDISLIKLDRMESKKFGERDLLSYSLLLNTSNFMDIQFSGIDERDKFFSKFDLLKNPKDVCIKIYGAGFMNAGNSNVMILKKSDVEELRLKSEIIKKENSK